jgi:multiple sugar transport system substrate-binding protein
MQAMDEIAKQFETETGIRLDYEIIDWSSANNKYSLAMKGGECPDVAEWFFLQSFQAMGGEKYGPLMINDVAQEVGADELYFPAALNECKVGDDYYALPWRMDVRIMAYREDMLKEAGVPVPTTWDELIQAGHKLTKKDGRGNYLVSGVAYYITRGDFFQSAMATLAQNGTSVMDLQGTQSTIATPEAIEALSFMQRVAVKEGIMSPSHASSTVDILQEFMAGKIAILLGANPDFLIQQEISAPQLNGKVKGALMPSKTGDGVSSIMYAAPVSVMKTAKDIEAAKTFLKFFMRDDIQLKISKATGLINANRTVMKDDYFSSQWNQTLSSQANRALNGDLPVTFWSRISAFPQGPVANAVNNILAGADVASEARYADRAIDEIIQDNR